MHTKHLGKIKCYVLFTILNLVSHVITLVLLPNDWKRPFCDLFDKNIRNNNLSAILIFNEKISNEK